MQDMHGLEDQTFHARKVPHADDGQKAADDIAPPVPGLPSYLSISQAERKVEETRLKLDNGDARPWTRCLEKSWIDVPHANPLKSYIFRSSLLGLHHSLCFLSTL
jgi:hypothetical protein